MRLQGKTALITGAARGIGLAFAKAYLAEGARVALGDLDGAGEAAAKLGPQAMGLVLDVTDQASIDAGVASVADWGGGIDILVNNAGVLPRSSTSPAPALTGCSTSTSRARSFPCRPWPG